MQGSAFQLQNETNERIRNRLRSSWVQPTYIITETKWWLNSRCQIVNDVISLLEHGNMQCTATEIIFRQCQTLPVRRVDNSFHFVQVTASDCSMQFFTFRLWYNLKVLLQIDQCSMCKDFSLVPRIPEYYLERRPSQHGHEIWQYLQ